MLGLEGQKQKGCCVCFDYFESGSRKDVQLIECISDDFRVWGLNSRMGAAAVHRDGKKLEGGEISATLAW